MEKPPSVTKPPRDFDGLRADLAARSGTLTKRLRQVAQFLLNHREGLAVTPLVRLADQAQVPPATITRFAKGLGFAGFADLQLAFPKRLLGPRLPFAERMAQPGITDADRDEPGHLFGSIGRRAHLVDNLGAMRAMQVQAIGPADTLLVMTFDDCTPKKVEVAQRAAQRGLQVLAVTNNALSPVAGLASHVPHVNGARLGHFRSQVRARVVCQALIVALGRRVIAAKTIQNARNESSAASTCRAAKDVAGGTP